MIDSFAKNADLSKKKVQIPKWVIGIVVLAYLTPFIKEIILYKYYEWLWFLYIIPALVLAYYHGVKGAFFNLLLAGGMIISIESYYFFVLGAHSDVYFIITVSIGTIFTMGVASFVVGILSEKLHIAKNSASLILETTSTGVGIVDRSGKVVYINKALEQIIGKSLNEVVGQYHWEIHKQKGKINNHGVYSNIVMDTLETGKFYHDHEIVIRGTRGARTFLIDTYPIYNDMQEIVGAMANLRDITERKEMERKVQQIEKFNVLGQMAEGLAHEIRNPITSVKGFLQVFEEKESDKIRRKYWTLMLGEINKVNNLITEFLLLTKPVAPKVEKTSLVELINKVLTFMACDTNLYNISVSTNYASRLPDLFIDREQIQQVLTNVLRNAIEAMPEGGTLEIACGFSPTSDDLIIEISDSGFGIDAETIKNIYDPFYTTKNEGTGLGLAVTYKIIENHGGWIKIDSIKRKGTKVTIALPYANTRIA